MDTLDERIPDEDFSEFLKHMPQVSVEIVVEYDNSVLLVKRTNEPAEGEWFWPGTRLYKGETFEEAVYRLAKEELGIKVEIQSQLGAYNHFWDTGRLNGVDSTHTVNIVYHVQPRPKTKNNFDIQLDDQHEDYRFIEGTESDLHPYVVEYLQDNQLL